MFSTFKPLESGSGSGQYILESTASPFDKPSHKISRLACVYCRSKKVKCTGEEGGCQRCLDKQIACSYISPSRTETDTVPKRLQRLPRLQRVAKDADGGIVSLEDDISTPQRESEQPTERPAEQPAEQPIEQSLNVETRQAWDAIIGDSDLLGMDFDMSPSATTHDKHSTYVNSSNLFFDVFQADEATTATAITPIPADKSPPAYRAERPSTDDTPVPPSPSSSPIPSPNPSHCLCSEMLDVFEAVEVSLAWAHHTIANPSACTVKPNIPPSSTPNDQFMCQKEVLSSCEKWLNRDASHIQSRHAVLMISILDRVLASILSMAEMPKDRKVVDTQASPVPPRRPLSYGLERPPRNLLMSTMEVDHYFQLDQWNMNDEERIHVFKSLLNYRASRLRGLLERLGVITALNRWQMQTNMVQYLLDQLSKHRNLL